MLQKIIDTIKKLDIGVWLINETVTESAEVYFICKNEDMRRMKKTRDFSVTVFRDFDSDGKKMRGSSCLIVHPGMSEEEISFKLKTAYDAAQYVKNPYFELAGPVKDTCIAKDDLSVLSPEEALTIMSEALFAPDRTEDAFINSAEIYAVKKTEKILSSAGTDVMYTSARVKGEFVVQCISPKDVEMYFDFSYNNPDTLALSKLASDAIDIVSDRAKASEAPAAGEYNLILTEKHVYTLLSSYLEKADASMIFAGYSPYRIGTCVQGDSIKGEKLNITLIPSLPYSSDGIPMPERPLLEEGVLKTIPGATRFSRYLGIEPVGSYDAIRVSNGTLSLEDTKKQPCILPVAFSDFQMDAMSGRFGGEIRLAYIYDGENVKIVTGGSVSGSLIEKQSELTFSKETYKDSVYSGPAAILIPGASVAGA